MAQPVSQPIPALYNGVSRQPHPVRLPSQVEAADNVVLDVVDGGPRRRPPSQHIAALDAVDPEDHLKIHTIDRDDVEQYIVILDDSGELFIYDTDGVAQTVNAYSSAIRTYLTAADPADDIVMLTVADHTFVLNRTVATEQLVASGTLTGSVATFADLPSPGTTGHIYRVTNGPSPYDDYYVTWDATTDSWVETRHPAQSPGWDDATMPHLLRRQANGEWEVVVANWDVRQVGDDLTVPMPGFSGRTITDLFFHKNRLGFVYGESIYTSQAGDYFNLWPDEAVTVKDSDPVERAATTNAVTLLRWAVALRKSLFLLANKAQFELSSGTELTPTSAAIDLTTTYDASPRARPVTLGNDLYFPATQGGGAVVWEYGYDDEVLSHVAEDVTRHAAGYVPAEITALAAEAVSGSLFCLTSGDPESVYVLTTYWKDREKAQQAWHRWSFSGATVRAIGVLGTHLYLVVVRGDELHLERVPVGPEAPEPALGFKPFLDRRVEITGVYDSGADVTTWTLPYDADETLRLVLGADFGDDAGRMLPWEPGDEDNEIQVPGDHSAGPAYIGQVYTSRVELSRIYLRAEEGRGTVIQGRLQLRRMRFAFKDTAHFRVRVTPQGRDPFEQVFTGRIIGAANNLIGRPAINDLGTFDVRIGANAVTTRIEILSDSHLPFTITSASWEGVFSETTQHQGLR